MPELPEVEVVRKGIAPRLTGSVVHAVRVRERRLRWPVPEDLATPIVGRQVLSVGRRGKYLLLSFGTGTLIVHLGMSGQLRVLGADIALRRHDHLDIETSAGLLRFNDPRRFGAVLWHPVDAGPLDAHPLLASLGAEPLEPGFDGEFLHRATRGRKLAIKQLLLAGREVVGVGNIYASESLFRAGIRPTARAGGLSRQRCEALARAIRETLSDAIARGGSSLRDFVSAQGEQGYFQIDCQVYGRAGEPCRRCGTPIRLLRQQQRATYFCPGCQPR
jgi:formamidopyrimidine-DNA glycosylase